ncbi:hypothetical protein GH714_024316 [Hevea brasiliensis]|uniref:Pentacotripeptide-repeat region of PRORP domain-containing protein n=1 Tax=Hevea brasiliensis TaxID=3981 RepID=A0A6A6LZY1_HEVBR|nr:hypothetical protein GH714_024316 [Hevea brasiliensis]
MPQLFGRTKNVSKRSKKYLEEALYFRLFKEGSSELSEAMSKRGMNKTVSDQAIHLDLVAKTRGITAAENYFIDLPETLKNHLTYGALLNCYCKELMTEEAEALMEKMKELNLGLTSMSYNSLMTLYTKRNGQKYVPSPEIVGSFMAHFEQQKDVDRAEGFIEILKKAVDNVGANVFESLIRTYAAAGRTSSVMLRRLKMENVEVSEASQKLLEVISVE